jgi:hypothetical protein
VLPFLLAQLIGGGLGYLLTRTLYPRSSILLDERQPQGDLA